MVQLDTEDRHLVGAFKAEKRKLRLRETKPVSQVPLARKGLGWKLCRHLSLVATTPCLGHAGAFARV